MAAARHTWMFRAAAVVFLLFGFSWLYTFGLTRYHPEWRPYGLAGGVIALLVGVFLFRRHKLAIGISAVSTGFLAICAAVVAPTTHGPVILFLAALAIVCAVYAALAARELFGRTS